MRYFFAALRRGASGSTHSPWFKALITAIRAIMTIPRFSAAAMRHSTGSCQFGRAACFVGRAMTWFAASRNVNSTPPLASMIGSSNSVDQDI